MLKTDGLPTYHMANIVDDHFMKITHVIRGEEWLPSTPLHVLLYRYLGWEKPEFYHLPLILRPTGNGKLSKRDGAKFGFPVFAHKYVKANGELDAEGFKEYGFLPESVVNFLALLGWNPGTDQEMFSLDDLVAVFDLQKINKSGARYDYDKAKWFNQQYLMKASDDTLVELAGLVFAKHGHTPDNKTLQRISQLLRERVVTTEDFWNQGKYFFEPVAGFDNEKIVRKKWKPASRGLLEQLMSQLIGLADFEAGSIEGTIKSFMEEHGIGFGDVLPFLRLGLSGTMKGPSVFDIMEILGKQESNKRMTTAFEQFEAIAG